MQPYLERKMHTLLKEENFQLISKDSLEIAF